MILSAEEWEAALAALENAEFTPEQLERARLLGEKMKSLSYEECRAIRMKLDEEDGHC